MRFHLIMLLSLSLQAAKAQLIPNPGFEDWSTSGGIEQPTGWTTTNVFYPGSAFKPVTKSSPGIEGNYALRLETRVIGTDTFVGAAGTGTYSTATGPKYGYPFSRKPARLTFNYKYIPAIGDSMAVYVSLQKWSGTGTGPVNIASGYFVTGVRSDTFTQASLQLYYGSSLIPDTATIYIAASVTDLFHSGSVLYVDKLGFVGGNVDVVEPQRNEPALSVYPNPAAQMANFSLHGNCSGDALLVLTDLTGKQIWREEKPAGQAVWQWDPTPFPDGIYLYTVQTGRSVMAGKLLIRR